MTEIPFRGLGTIGLNTDIDPRSLPTLPQQAWTEARNVRFENGSIQRGPRFRLNGTLETGRPTHVQAHSVPNATYEILVGYYDGRIRRIFGRDDVGGPCVEQDVTPTTHQPNNYPAASSTCTLEDVCYWNRPDHKLWAMLKNGEKFEEVKNWGDDWRCRAIRAYNNVVVAINVSRGGRTYPCMVKSSDLAPYGVSDQEWVATATNSATENLIGALADRLVDGLPIRKQMFLYTQTETWVMTPNYTATIYDYQPAFNYGMISTNCGVVVNGMAYVMGRDGIWTHNSATPQPLSKGRFDKAVYKYMLHSQEWQFFTVHNPKRSEVMFCFVSSDPDAKFPVGPGKVPAGFDDYPGCNMALTYNYAYDTAVLDDLPYVVGGGFVSPYQGTRWEQLTDTWKNLQGTWDSLSDHTQPAPIFVSAGAPAMPAISATDDHFDFGVTVQPAGLSAGDVTIPMKTEWHTSNDPVTPVTYPVELFLARAVGPESTGIRLVSIRPPYAMPLRFTEGSSVVDGYLIYVNAEESAVVQVPFTIADDQGRTSDAIAWCTIGEPDHPPPLIDIGDHN